MAELLSALEDGWKLTTCVDEEDAAEHECSVHNLCPIRGPLNEIHRALMGALKDITLADVFRPKAGAATTFQPVLSILNHRPPATVPALQETSA